MALATDLITPPLDKQSWMVRGRIVSHELQGLDRMRVLAVDKNVGREVPLGESTSRERGAYEIQYFTARLEKQKPDVQVQVVGEDGKVLAVSAIRYNAGRVESGLDIVIPADTLPLPAEYPRLTGELGDHLGKLTGAPLKKRLATLKEDEEQQDITYLANKTGWDARMVAMTSLASQFAEQSGIEPEFYYALFRAGVPANESGLNQMTPETVRQAWERAVEQKVLPAELKQKIPQSLERFKAYSAGRLLEEPPQIGVSSFKELIHSVLNDGARQRRFAQLYYEKKHDLPSFWESVRAEFPNESDRLQLDSKLAFLTVNNVPLIRKLHNRHADIQTPIDLVRHGLYQRASWEELLADDVPIPIEIPGEQPEIKKGNYAALMASHLRLSYPTAVVAELVRADTIPLRADRGVKTGVTQFLDAHQGKFELGLHPVGHYLRKNGITLEPPVVAELNKLSRVFQISPSDEIMVKLLEHDLTSASAVVRHGQRAFVNKFKDELGGEAITKLTYAKAHQVHHAVLNIVTAYLLDRTSPSLYATKSLRPDNGTEETGVIAYPTLEEIFGEMDYCACEHCRSWLSPAAYLVDLLQFLEGNPLNMLFERRPDIQHLQLSCENTNTVLPYIDLVNEILEHFVVNGSLATFTGHNVSTGVATEDLLANPQFVNDAAYVQLRDHKFPPPLPFHQPLEALRRYFDHFDVPLHKAMELLRRDDSFERAGDIAASAYAWRDVLMERLRISRPEYIILTDGNIRLQSLYGEDPNTVTVHTLINSLHVMEGSDPPRPIGIGNAKLFARKFGLTYEELIVITRTQFINRHSHLIPKLEKLTVTFKTIQDFLDGTLTNAQFSARVPLDDLDMTQYGGRAERSRDNKLARIKTWLQENVDDIMGLIVLSDPTGSENICSFDTVELRYARPDNERNQLRPVEFLKLLRFIRLWRKLGWTIEQTDQAMAALYPADHHPAPTDDTPTAKTELDAKFRLLLDRLAHLDTVMEQLKLSPKRDLTALLACWSTIDTNGYHSLYHRMFLNPTILTLDEVFQEDGYGNYLAEKREYKQPMAEPPSISAHAEALCAAFNLTQEEFDLILQELGFNASTVLDLTNVSAIFRHSYLARKLRLSVREFLALKAMSGLDPFLPLDLVQPTSSGQSFGAVRPPAVRFIELAQDIKDSPFKVSQLLYFLQHIDLSGKASPPQETVLTLARTLRNDLVRVDNEHIVQEDPSGEIARAKMALVYDAEATDIFFGLLNNTSPFSVPYHHGQSALETDILAVTDRIAYDRFEKQLSFSGVMTVAQKTALDSAASATTDFRTAVQALFDNAQVAFAAFFEQYPELKDLYVSYVNSSASSTEKMSALLTDFLPGLRARLKSQQVRQTISAQVGADLSVVTLLLENARLLHAVDGPTKPALADFAALEKLGVSADIFFGDDVVGEADQTGAVSTIDYRVGGTALPLNPANANAPISGVWHGFLEAPDNGFYTFYIQTNDSAAVTLRLDEDMVVLVLNNGVLQNEEPVKLEAGRFYELRLTARKVRDVLVLKWERKGMGRTPIASTHLYPAASVARFETSYLRLLKAVAIANVLELSEAELSHFAGHADYKIGGEGWLNALPTAPSSASPTTHNLLRNVLALLQYRWLKESLKVRDESLLELLQDPSTVGEDGEPSLPRASGWQQADQTTLLDRFALMKEDLAHVEHFVRLHKAFGLIKKLGIGAEPLSSVTTNEPMAENVRTLQGALRARYDQSAWLKIIQPINDGLRGLQRDALVGHVLHRLGQSAGTRHLDTGDKLFEYFLIDVQMDPCMKTSRIKQAISSVQLFIQRCLLNLEAQVPSSSIDAHLWEWMKRYRIWEANRKVFLWPENWLEPELRDNKSSFFKDLESELLQSDITDDAAATALVHYLEKLDEVAKLEICGMYYEENEVNNRADDVIHVIGRTAGARRAYYYRRQEQGISWSPWEQIDLNIEDNPVLPVVWKGRLFLFWVSVLQEALETSSSPSNEEEPEMWKAKPSQLKQAAGEAQTRVAVALYWSEYYHGKWQPARTSDVNKPTILDDFRLGEFDRRKLRLNVSRTDSHVAEPAKADDSQPGAFSHSPMPKRVKSRNAGAEQRQTTTLIIGVTYDGGSTSSSYYKLHNTHSLPVRQEDDDEHQSIKGIVVPHWRRISLNSAPLTIKYSGYISPFSRLLLGKGMPYEIIEPRHPVMGVFEAPFFYQDPRHVFFVKTEESSLLALFTDVYLWVPQPGLVVEPLVPVKADLPAPQRSFFPRDLVRPGMINTSLLESILGVDPRARPNIHRTIATREGIQFGDRVISLTGSVATGANIENKR